jgi:cytoplasmic iron level regulating protein YaaA (DUF328/UPF0246 family)
MIAVVSPAKKLDTAPIDLPLDPTQPQLLDQTELLMGTTRRLSPKALRSLMGISEKLAELNHHRFQSFATPFTPDNAKPAALTFNGDVYLGLDAGTLSTPDLAWAQDHVAILSGLYGLLRPFDLMQPYRLEMGTRLKTRRGKNLYAFWGQRITDRINTQLTEHADQTLVNLASNEYFKAVKLDKLSGVVITPVFKELRDGGPKVISFMAKRARGEMTRFMVQQRLDRPEGLKDFDQSGYRFDQALSTPTTWTFTRPQS